jgi:hypothetical protein
MSLHDDILAQFEPEVAVGLIEFGKSFSLIDADILVFMARKSLCLYDALLRVGIPPIERCLVSDRTLDMRLEPFTSKRVALIDDSLIVGTTLAKAKRALKEKCGAEVSVHVFCVDKDWWCEELVRPDTVGMVMDDRAVMTFCTGEVRHRKTITFTTRVCCLDESCSSIRHGICRASE